MKTRGPKRRLCTRCGSSRTERLLHASRSAEVDHYRCNSCGHIWTQPKTPRASHFRVEF
jgi:uncharacterized Zn finger protein